MLVTLWLNAHSAVWLCDMMQTSEFLWYFVFLTPRCDAHRGVKLRGMMHNTDSEYGLDASRGFWLCGMMHITEFLKNSNISGKSKCFSGARGYEYKNRGRKSLYTPLQNIWQFELWNFLFWQLFRKISRLVEIFWVLFYEYSMTGLVGAESQSWRLTLKARLRNTANIYHLD